ncbi:hypothetical protein PS880_05484 [Pseudomonas fluorescens]|uniref:Uncharacterized protein n=1 Tax=Pseudomonas fluorescens TaxID=294 RepID=A0A5E7PVC1_PSEFL|nr:hypothetical protein PS880_05484 [Pseudomonas fluorescens]
MTNEQQAQAEMPIWLVIVLALGGADVAIGLYEHWAAAVGRQRSSTRRWSAEVMNRIGAPKTAGDPGVIRWTRGRKPARTR